MHSGNFVLILHTHLPWVLNHGTWPHGVDWLNEAVAECYIPLLNAFNDLSDEGILPKVTIDISPVLCEQLEHPSFKKVFLDYCDEKIAAAKENERDFSAWGWDAHHIYLTQYWQQWYTARRNDFENRYKCSIVSALKKLQDEGAIEVMTCGATHGYLPLLGTERSINLQIKAAVENYNKYFNRMPRGIWLPECAYRPSYNWKSMIPVHPFHIERLRPGIEQFLSRHGIEYFITDEPLTARAQYIGAFTDIFKDRIVTANSQSFNSKEHSFSNSPLELFNVSSSEKIEYGTAVAFTRHRNIALQVWSGEIGYPGEPDYLDFHKKHLGSMLRYWRVTDNKADMMYKQLYHPDWIWKKIDLQANHFIHHIENTLNWNQRQTGKFGTLCVPFDTELFGHWWFEGPEFIKAVIKGLYYSPYVKTATASESMFRMKPLEIARLPEGSWGKNNNHDVWSNPETIWTWESLYNNENRLTDIFHKVDAHNSIGTLRRILTQTLREFMLQQSSDWQFLITTQSARDYAEQRFSFHHSDFNRLCDIAEKYHATGELEANDEKILIECENRNSVFTELNIDWWTE